MNLRSIDNASGANTHASAGFFCCKERGIWTVRLKTLLKRLFPKISRKTKREEGQTECIEEDTECDLCEFLDSCVGEGNLIQATMPADTRRHFIRGVGAPCIKYGWGDSL